MSLSFRFIIDEITTLEGLEGIAPAWEELFEACPMATPFQSPRWLIPWSRHLDDGSPFALALRGGGALAGLATFTLKGEELFFSGTGVSDYLDILSLPGLEEEAAMAVVEYLSLSKGRWRRCDLRELKPSSAMLSPKVLNSADAEKIAGKPCLSIDLPSTFDELIGKRGSKGRNGAKRTRKKLDRSASISVETASMGDLPEFLESFFTLHLRRWNSLGRKGVLEGAEIRSFHNEAAAGFLHKGLLRLYRMRYQGSDMAALYSFLHRGRMYAYLSGFEPDLAALSPGARMLEYAVEDAIRAGAKEVDFLRGAESYKYVWMPKESRNYMLVIQGKDR